MPLKSLRPPRRVGTFSALAKEQAVRVADRSQDAEWAGYRLARVTALFKRQGLSFREIERLLANPEFQAVSPGLRLVTAQRLQQLHARYEAGATSASDFAPGRRGRRALPLAPDVRAEARRLVLAYGAMTPMTELHRSLNAYIAARELGAPISYGRFKRLFASVSREVRTAAAYGTRAGELYGTSHATVACRATHEIWTIDAFTAPWWEKALVLETQQWVITRPSVIVVKDYKSDAIVGYWISDPARRRDQQGRVCTEGFDAADVYAAILAAAIPALASPATVALSGRLPECIRWDRHSVNNLLREIMCDVAERLAVEGDSFFGAAQPEYTEMTRADGAVERCLVEVPRLPGFRPKNRGDVERAIGFLKQMCWAMPGHVDLYLPTPLAGEDQGRTRTRGASDGALAHRSLPLKVEHLPTRAETGPDFDARVAAYNVHRNRRTGRTRLERFHAFMPRSPRKGTDALALMTTTATFVTSEGIEVFHDGTSSLFEPYIAATGMRFALDAPVVGKADVFYRGFFVRVGTEVHLLPPKDVWAAEPGNAERVAREQRAVARAASQEADAVRRLMYDVVHGVGSATDALREAEEIRRAREEARRAASAPVAAEDSDARRIASKRLVDQAAVHAEASASRAAHRDGSVARAETLPTHAPPAPLSANAADLEGEAARRAAGETPREGRPAPLSDALNLAFAQAIRRSTAPEAGAFRPEAEKDQPTAFQSADGGDAEGSAAAVRERPIDTPTAPALGFRSRFRK